MRIMRDADWGLQVGKISLEESFSSDFSTDSMGGDESSNVILSDNIKFPLELIYQVAFVGGKRGSGKSYSAAVMMEEFDRLGLQFVCIDPLDAHGHLSTLEGVESITPSKQETINMGKLVKRIKDSKSSLVINMSDLSLDLQQKLISEYCEALLGADIGEKGLLTILEECQDFVPQVGRPESFAPIVRLCKLGRAKGYGVALISQRPAAVSKEALSQASIYMVHNVINTKDLDALKEQLSFGTDKETIRKILNGITYAEAGEMVCYAPEFFKDEGYVVVGKVNRPRRTEHKGKNIDVRASLMNQYTPFARSEGISTGEEFMGGPGSMNRESEGLDNSQGKSSWDKLEAEDDFEEELPEPVSEYEWSPEGDEMFDLSSEDIGRNGSVFKAVGAIGLISVGCYFITRGLVGRQN